MPDVDEEEADEGREEPHQNAVSVLGHRLVNVPEIDSNKNVKK